MRTATVFRRNSTLNITVLWAITPDSRGTVFGQPLGRNNCGCQGVSASTTVVSILLSSCRRRFTPYFSQSCQKEHWVLDELPAPCSEIPSR